MSASYEGKSMAHAEQHTQKWFERYSWTVFVFLSAILLLFGASDLAGAVGSTAQETAIDELFIGCLSATVAVMGLRRRQRWTWFAMALWPAWIAAQSARAASTGNGGEAVTGVLLLVLALGALALAYRPSFKAANEHNRGLGAA